MATRNEKARLRKVTSHLERALDEFHRAAGELYPPPLKRYRTKVDTLITMAVALRAEAAGALSGPTTLSLPQMSPEALEEAEND